MKAEELADSVSEMLAGAELRSIGRSSRIGEVQAVTPGGDTVEISVHCSFRMTRGDWILLGSQDLTRPARDEPPSTVGGNVRSVYDAWADRLNAVIRNLAPAVTEVSLGDAGDLVIAWDDIRLEVLPCGSGGAEAWRIVSPYADHGYPSSLI